MAALAPSWFFFIMFLRTASISVSFDAISYEQDRYGEIKSVGRRFLLGFKETPRGSNVTFECSPSGPCVPCLYSEKNKEKYRCSETGYRIPFKCVEITKSSDAKDGQEAQNDRSTLETFIGNVNSDAHPHHDRSTRFRNLLNDSPPSKQRSQSYITYRSCVPTADEKLSVIGFEGIMLGMLLISGTFVYKRKRRTISMPGVSTGRSQSNSRF